MPGTNSESGIATVKDSSARRTDESASSDREIVSTRVIDAPRDIAFKLWTDPDHLGSWWGPKGFTTTTDAMNAKPGGAWRFRMHGPDGVDYPNSVTYIEVVKPERIVFDHGEGDGKPDNFRVIATFADRGGRTSFTMRMVFPSAEARDLAVETYGAEDGLNQTLDRLGECAAAIAGPARNVLTVTLPSDREILLTRTFDAPRRLVYEACSKPEHVARWWGPLGSTMIVCEMDFRPGGAWRFVLRMPDGSECPFKGVYREITPPERTVSTFIFDVDFIRDFETVETATFEEHDGKTTLRVTVLHKSKESRDRQIGAGMEAGASQSYDRLAELLATIVRRPGVPVPGEISLSEPSLPIGKLREISDGEGFHGGN